jgi:hypothetical protein
LAVAEVAVESSDDLTVDGKLAINALEIGQ